MGNAIGTLVVLAFFLITATNLSAYDFPVADPYVATIAGTPPEYKAKLPAVPERRLQLEVFPEREPPPVLWYQKKLVYSLAAQKHKAPLVFIVAAAGGSYNAPTSILLQRALYQGGFHVVSLASPTHPNFIVTASTTSVPGNIPDDAKDLYRVMKLIKERLDEDLDVSGCHLLGYSLGGVDAAFVAHIDDQEKAIGFQRVLLIDPPVSLYTSIHIIDRMLDENIPGGIQHLDQFIDRVMTKLAGYYRSLGSLDFNNSVLYQVFEKKGTNDQEIAALIGINFRLVSSNMVFASDVINHAGYLVPRNKILTSTDSTTQYLKVAFHITFQQYFDEYFYPYFHSRDPGLTKEHLIESSSLRSIEGYLKRTGKIGVMANEDDMIVTPGDRQHLRDIFGQRLIMYPRGGHLGNIDFTENVQDLLRFFKSGEGK